LCTCIRDWKVTSRHPIWTHRISRQEE
jgi:hypothetical protein